MAKTGSVAITLEQQDTPITKSADTPEPHSKKFKPNTQRNVCTFCGAECENQLNVRQTHFVQNLMAQMQLCCFMCSIKQH